MSPPTALGVMARAPVAGRCKTRLHRRMSPEAAAALADAMTRDTLEAVDRAGFGRRVLFAAPLDDRDEGAARAVRLLAALTPASWEVVPQVPGDLGARMEAALATLLPGGAVAAGSAGRAALIGTDAPHAPLDALREELDRLESGVLVGPADDGGYWALGMRQIELAVLRDMPWSTSHLADATRARCAEAGLALVEIAPTFDVDAPDDVDRLARALAEDPTRAPATARWLEASGRALRGAPR